jgi:hypothetical protein
MSERMTDERLAEIDCVLKAYMLKGSENMTTYFEHELVQALKAEREIIKRVKAEVRNIDTVFSHPDTTSHEAYRDIRSIVKCLRKALERLDD